jgi:hypothetical protein
VDQRNRLLVVARTLRRFGIVDHFGIGDILQRGRTPSKQTIERLIKESSRPLPPGVNAKFLTERILDDLATAESHRETDDDQQLLKLVAVLPQIPVGKSAAHKFHIAMLDILPLLFESRLGSIKKEQEIFDGLKYVDLKANNDQKDGIFAQLRDHFRFYSPYVFIECKNYAEDLKNPEFDQLIARLGPTTTQIGCIICRRVTDSGKVLDRAKVPFNKEHKLILVLADADITRLANARIQSGPDVMDAMLKEYAERVILS